jgi:hypothetical protein
VRTILKTLRLLSLGLWLGAAVFFGAAVAPNLFGVLRGAQLPNANETAGTIVTRLVATINLAGFAISVILIVTTYFANKVKGRLAWLAEMISLAIMAIMTGVSHWLISARMLALRGAMQAPIDRLAPDDPRRAAFDSLHRLSVAAMGLAILAALVAFAIIAGANTRKLTRGNSPTPGSPAPGSPAAQRLRSGEDSPAETVGKGAEKGE